MRFIVHKRGYRLLPLLALALAVGLVLLVGRGSYGASDLGPFEIDGYLLDAEGDPLPCASYPPADQASCPFKSYYSGNDAPPADDWADGDGAGGTNGVFELSAAPPHFASCYGSDVDLTAGYSPDTTRFICDGFTGLDIGKPENSIVSPAGDIPHDLWPITTANNVTPKDDLSHGYFILQQQPCTGEDDHTIVIVGMERGNNEGANHWGIELNQIPPTGLQTIADGVPPAADFALDFNRQDGDVFISVDLERGGVEPTITVTQVNGTPAQGADASFDLATALAICPDYANNRTSTNLVEQVAPPWNIFSCDPTTGDGGTNMCRVANGSGTGLAAGECGSQQTPQDCTRVAPRDFVEVAIDLTAYGLSAECFADVLLTTRSAPPGGVDPDTGEVDLSGADIKDVTGDFLDVCGVEVTKSGDTLSKVGDPADYSITVHNTGSVPLYMDDITDTLFGNLVLNGVVQAPVAPVTAINVPAGCAILTPDDEAAGGTDECTITVSRTVQAGDPDPLPNTVTIVYNSNASFTGTAVSDTDDHTVNLFQPSITLDKTGDTLSKVGDSVDYTITFNNTSSADTPDLTCDFSDSLLGALDQNVVVASGGSHVINTSRTVLAGDPDPLLNTASVVCTVNGFSNVLNASDGHSVNLFQPSITLDKTGDTLSKVGDSVDYTITFNNTSSADTPDLTCDFSDSLLGALDQNVVVASGGSDVINTSRTVLAGDPDPLVNTASVVCTVDGFSNTLNASNGHSVNLFQPSITLDKTGDTLSKVGDSVDYTITFNNTSSADTPDLTCDFSDSLLGALDQNVVVASGGSHVINTSRTVLAGDPDPLLNTASVVCTVNGFSNVLNASDGHSVNLFQPSITLDKTGDTLSKVGDSVDYTITFNNTSSADTPDLTCDFSDSLLGPLDQDVVVASGGSHVINASRTVLGGDPDPLLNTASVSCSPAGFLNVLTDSDGHSVDLFGPTITLDKTGDTLSKVGDSVNYTITFNNTSSADSPDLTCDFSDSLLGALDQDVVVAAGAGHVINTSRTVLAGDPDPLVNTASVTCTVNGFPNTLTDSDGHSVNLFQPSIDIDKTGDTLSKVGDSVDYTITVTNTSSADSPNCVGSVTDALLGINQAINLAPGAVLVIGASRTVLAGDPDPLLNTATVTCSPVGFPNTLTDSDGHSVNLFQPSIDIDKTGDTLSKVGDSVDYTITVTNTSSADSPNCVGSVTDALLGINQAINLAPGAVLVIGASRTVLAGDPDPLLNTATVTCSPAGFPNVLTDSDGHSVNLFQPGVDVEKACDDFAKFLATVDPPDVLDASDDIRCTITVTNTGSADSPDLENGTIVDTLCGNLLGTLNAECTPVSNTCTSTLATGGSCQIVYDFGGEFVTSTPDPISNTVTVHYNPIGFPNDITDTDTETIDVLHPNYTMTKDCLTEVVPPGGSAIFEVVFTNTGDTVLTVIADETMTDVSLVNNIGVVPAGTAFTLGVGVMKTFEITLVAGAGPIIENTVNTSASLPVNTGLTNVLNRTAMAHCDVEGGATRTPGFWQTHLDYTCHIFEDHLGGSIDLGWKTLDTCADVFGMFWANNARESDGTRRTKICQAQVIGSFQLLAAILNTGLDNGAAVPIDPVTMLDLITAMQNALAAGDFQEIKRLGGLLDDYNNSGDDIAIIDNDGTLAGRANPKGAKIIADFTIADCP